VTVTACLLIFSTALSAQEQVKQPASRTQVVLSWEGFLSSTRSWKQNPPHPVREL